MVGHPEDHSSSKSSLCPGRSADSARGTLELFYSTNEDEKSPKASPCEILPQPEPFLSRTRTSRKGAKTRGPPSPPAAAAPSITRKQQHPRGVRGIVKEPARGRPHRKHVSVRRGAGGRSQRGPRSLEGEGKKSEPRLAIPLPAVSAEKMCGENFQRHQAVGRGTQPHDSQQKRR